MKRRKWMALMLCAGIFMADFSGIPLKVSAEQVEQAETVLDDQGTQKDDGENTELIQETEDEIIQNNRRSKQNRKKERQKIQQRKNYHQQKW